MTTPHRIWTFVGIVGAVAGIVDVARQHKTRKELAEEAEQNMGTQIELPLDLDDTRDRIVAWAESQEGLSDPSPYWQSALDTPKGPKSWCGAFVLTALHKAGLATSSRWFVGKGLERTLPKLTRTSAPQRGDIAYYTKQQHMAIVADVKDGLVRLVNGNGAGGRVTINERPLSDAAAYYSIQPYLDEKELLVV